MTDNYIEDEESFINSSPQKKNENYSYDEESILPIEIFQKLFSEKNNQEYLEETENIKEEKLVNKDKINNKNGNNEDIQIIINNDKKTNTSDFYSSINSKKKTGIIRTIEILKDKKNIVNNTKVFGIVSNKVSLGRKRKDIIREIVGHDKFSDDNLIRKVKCTLIDILSSLINKLLDKFYNINFGKKENKKELLKMNQNQITSSKTEYNRNFISKALKDIFSHRISTKYTKHSPDHNKNIINQVLNEKNRDIKIKFENIFNLTFLDCLEHFRGTKYIKELEGMTNLIEYCNKFENDPDYICQFKYFVNNFEKIIFTKKLRNREKKYKSIESKN